MKRCPWGTTNETYIRYHDEEWGTPVHEENKHFEFLVLESAQAGLSWSTILMKRENYRKAYDHFDPVRVSTYNDRKVNQLLSNAGIVRNRRKIETSINNAKCFLAVQKEFGSFDRYIWSFVNDRPIMNRWGKISEIPARTPLSDQISRDLIHRGFKFVGSTIVYAHLQATGIVNDHIVTCFRYRELSSEYYRNRGG
jgi:DNA-3-methyladenine glycosylase I